MREFWRSDPLTRKGCVLLHESYLHEFFDDCGEAAAGVCRLGTIQSLVKSIAGGMTTPGEEIQNLLVGSIRRQGTDKDAILFHPKELLRAIRLFAQAHVDRWSTFDLFEVLRNPAQR